MKYISLLIIFLTIIFSGCNNKSTQSSGWERISEAKVNYSFNRVVIDNTAHPVFAIGRHTDTDRQHASIWKVSREGFTLSGIKLESGKSPLLYYSDRGALKKVAISSSGIWLPLFKEGGPTVEELDTILNEAVKVSN